jgi:signal transduction histidine kinase
MILLDAPSSATVAACAGFNSNGQKDRWATAHSVGRNAIAAHADPPDVQIEDNLIAVPLQAKRGLIGSLVISVDNVQAFEPKRSLLLTLGRELGIAIENARLYQQVQEREELRGELLRRSVEVQEEERQRIARELHDGVGQTFTALALGLSGIEETMPRDPGLARQQVGNLKELSIRAITEMRQLVADLRPSQLDDLGLVPAIHWLAEEWRSRLKLDVRVQVSGHRRRLTPEMETVLFRITQEGLTNIAKHAHAQHALVRLSFDTDPMELRIEDDGVGMTPEQASRRLTRNQGWGLAGIRERAALVGGDVEVDSTPGHGTRLTIHIPLGEQEAAT